MSSTKFIEFITLNNLKIEIIESDEVTHSAAEAASVHQVPVSNIVKSLLAKVGEEFIICLVPGDQRLDLGLLKEKYQVSSVRMANADEVKNVTGYSIGGVPPFGHKTKLKTIIMDGFDVSTVLVAAGGANNTVFKIKLDELKKILF